MNLTLLFDGTWNDPQDRTNVFRLCTSLADHAKDRGRQRFFYDPGVGTNPLTRLRGGLFGYGLSRNLRQGYDWLARHYADGDRIFIFGFSRGAYTARSLVGLIRKCGLLRVSTPDLLARAETIYRDKQIAPDDPAARTFRDRFSRPVSIHMIGVWDTVGALGIPGTQISEKGRYAWHDTQLSGIVRHACQAMALDEHRSPYDVVLWTHPTGRKKFSQIDVEQRWFTGAHANVGGGYGDDPLADLPLAWIQKKALAAGLDLTPCTPPDQALTISPRDSFAEFLGGTYQWFARRFKPNNGRYIRKYDTDPDGNPAINVTVDPSVWERWHRDPAYRPLTLVNKGLTPPRLLKT
jgi:uncharacterized protein (DUF2235 family)